MQAVRSSIQAVLGLAMLAVLACDSPTSEGPITPSGPATVTVTSPVDTVLALGKTVQLSAVTRDDRGNIITGTSISWETSDPSILTVSSTGIITAQGVGDATVSATVGGVSGSLRLGVVDADLATVSLLAGDPLASSLVEGLSAARRPAVQAAWGACSTGASFGNVVAIAECVADVRAEATAVTEGGDLALLAVLVLYVDEIERRLGL